MTGSHRSRSSEDILAEVSGLAHRGVKELLLVAQDLTYYGRDLYGENRLPALLREMCRIDGIEWIRLHYGYPTHFPYELLDVMREEEKICKYMDIALQHSSDHVLKLMRRHVTEQETRELLLRMRQEVPGIHIRTTMMVGHPGERESDFSHLLDFVREMRFERLGAFAYSHEEGTYGYQHYEDDIPVQTKLSRLEALMSVQETIAFEVAAQKIGQVLPTIIDRVEGEYYVGRTRYDSPDVDPEVLIPTQGRPLEIGEIYDVKIYETQGFDLLGQVPGEA